MDCGTSRPQGPRADIGAFEALAPGSGPFILSQPQAHLGQHGRECDVHGGGCRRRMLAYQSFNNGVAIAGATTPRSPDQRPAGLGRGLWVGLTAAGVETTARPPF